MGHALPGCYPFAIAPGGGGGGGGGSVNSVNAGTDISVGGTPTDPVVALAGTITSRPIFNPASANSPFRIGANAAGVLVTDLNADKLDGLDSTAFALASHTHAASDITSGALALARGGSAADLSATGGSGHLVRQNSAGGAFTVARLLVGDADDGLWTYAKLQDVSATSRVLGRKTAGAGDIEEVTSSELLDFVGTTRGSVLYRGAAGWAILAPGTSGHVLTSNGAGADPSYQAAAGGGSSKWESSSGEFRALPAQVTAGDTFAIRGEETDGATAVGVILDNTGALADAGAKLVSIRNDGSEKAYFGALGELRVGGAGGNSGEITGPVSGPKIWVGRSGGAFLDLMSDDGSNSGIRLTGGDGGMRTGGSWSVDPGELLCPDGADSAVGDSGLKKSAGTGGNLSLIYDGSEVYRDDGTNVRVLASRGLALYTSIPDANPVVGFTSSALVFGAGGATAADVSLSRAAADIAALGAGDSLRWQGGTSGSVTLSPPASITSYTLTLPTAQGTGFLKNNGSGTLTWEAGGSGVVVSVVAGNAIDVDATDPANPIVAFDATELASDEIGWAKVSKSGSSLADLATRSASDLSSGTLAIARGGTGAGTATAAFDALSPMTTLGDTIYGGASGTRTRLAGNTSATSKFLRQTGDGANSAAPAWDVLASGDIPTLGISKITMNTARLLGRTTASSGAVEEITVGSGVALSAGALSAAAPTFVSLTDGATITVTASNFPSGQLGYGKVTLGGNRTLSFSGGTAGQKIEVWLLQDGTGSRTLAFDSTIAFSADLPSPLISTGASKKDKLLFEYDDVASKWHLMAMVRGF